MVLISKVATQRLAGASFGAAKHACSTLRVDPTDGSRFGTKCGPNGFPEDPWCFIDPCDCDEPFEVT